MPAAPSSQTTILSEAIAMLRLATDMMLEARQRRAREALDMTFAAGLRPVFRYHLMVSASVTRFTAISRLLSGTSG